ncbi:MAG TPA: biotin/lipoyl-containing protein [Ktedonobacterales bacterium]
MTEKQLLVSRVKALAEALEGSDVTELELNENGTRIVLKRHTEPVGADAYPANAPALRRPRPRHLPASLDGSSGSPAGIPAPEPTVAVVAPLTGVFYSRPSPSSTPFCQPGETVHPGQLVCIVEAMKVFNEIQCEVGGTVTAVVPKDGQLVQKGDALIRVKPF